MLPGACNWESQTLFYKTPKFGFYYKNFYRLKKANYFKTLKNFPVRPSQKRAKFLLFLASKRPTCQPWTLRSLGVVGCIVDGGVRDLDEMAAVGMHAFRSDLDLSPTQPRRHTSQKKTASQFHSFSLAWANRTQSSSNQLELYFRWCLKRDRMLYSKMASFQIKCHLSDKMPSYLTKCHLFQQ